MTVPPVFGDFLAQASGHITAAVSIRDELPAWALEGVVHALGRVVTTLARYLGDLPLPGEFDRPPAGGGPAADVRAALDARIALRRSAQVLRAATVPDHGGGEVHPAAWHLARAAGQLAAGRDLLHTHVNSDPVGAQPGASSWAGVICSPPVTGAMLGEIGGLAAQLAPWMMRLSLDPAPGSVMPATTGLALHDSSRWLWTAALTLEARARRHPPSGDARLVLASIPSALPPAHQPVAATESVPGLCQGVITTAARLQHAADAFARTARWSPQATSHSWGRGALACAITAHSSGVIVRSLSQRAAALGLDPMIQAHLDNTARALNPVCAASRCPESPGQITATAWPSGPAPPPPQPSTHSPSSPRPHPVRSLSPAPFLPPVGRTRRSSENDNWRTRRQPGQRLPDGGTQPGLLENELRNLQLTEPALLLRAGAIDEAARDLLAEATAKAHHQAASHEPTRAMHPRASGRRL